MFEIKEPTKFVIKLFGEEFNISAPTARSIKEITDQIESLSANGKSAFDAWVEWLEALGVGRASLEKLEMNHLHQLIDYVTGAKKN